MRYLTKKKAIKPIPIQDFSSYQKVFALYKQVILSKARTNKHGALSSQTGMRTSMLETICFLSCLIVMLLLFLFFHKLLILLILYICSKVLLVYLYCNLLLICIFCDIFLFLHFLKTFVSINNLYLLIGFIFLYFLKTSYIILIICSKFLYVLARGQLS